MPPELLLRQRLPELVDATEREEDAVAFSERLEGESREGELDDTLQDLGWERRERSRSFVVELSGRRGRGASFERVVHPSRASML
ncbi:hypothetical protein BCR35DRAFT_297994, partial [Leucosporidium creatinivorum]